MEFEKRLERAISRGQQTRDQRGRELAEQAMTEEELKNLHSRYRLDLSEHVEHCLRQLSDHFPGFRYQTVVGEEGWGATISRDDVSFVAPGRPTSVYSRFEMLIRPYSTTHIVELSAKGTIHNREVINRQHYQRLAQVDLDSFRELIDLWVLEYAEQYAARE